MQKTALLASADGDIRPVLASATASELAEAEALVRRIHPGYLVESIGGGTLGDDPYPPDDITYATVLPGAELLCDGRVLLDRPSDLPEHLLALGAGRRIIMHCMHSVVDWLAFAIWEDGNLIRSLSLSPDSGIMENIGDPYEFELPYWAGEHPVEPPYPLPFHPLVLGEERCAACSASSWRVRSAPTISTSPAFPCTASRSPIHRSGTGGTRSRVRSGPAGDGHSTAFPAGTRRDHARRSAPARSKLPKLRARPAPATPRQTAAPARRGGPPRRGGAS